MTSPANDGATRAGKLMAALMRGDELTKEAAGKIIGLDAPAAGRYLNGLAAVDGTGVHRREGQVHTWYFRTPRTEAAAAIAIVREMLPALRGTTLDKQLAATQQTLTSDMSAAHDYARRFYGHGRSRRLPDELRAETIDVVIDALRTGRELEVRYTHFEGTQDELQLHALSLVPHDEGLYCVARVVGPSGHRHVRQRRLYNVARFGAARLGPTTRLYPPSDEHDPEDLFRHTFGIFLGGPDDRPVELELRFAPKWGHYLTQHAFHGSQMLFAPTEDGWCRVRFTLVITYDLVRFIRGHGNEILVETPAYLRDRVESGEGSEARDRFRPR